MANPHKSAITTKDRLLLSLFFLLVILGMWFVLNQFCAGRMPL